MGKLKEKFLSKAYAKYYASKLDSAIGSSCASNFIKSENISKLRSKTSPSALCTALNTDNSINGAIVLFKKVSTIHKFCKAFKHISKAGNKDTNFQKFNINVSTYIDTITNLSGNASAENRLSACNELAQASENYLLAKSPYADTGASDIKSKILENSYIDYLKVFIAGTLIAYAKNTAAEIKRQQQEESTVKELDETDKKMLIKLNYDKMEKPYMTLYYKGKKRIWDRTQTTDQWIKDTYCNKPDKVKELLRLEPMTMPEKALAMLDGAKGSDIKIVVTLMNKAFFGDHTAMSLSKEKLEEWIELNWNFLTEVSKGTRYIQNVQAWYELEQRMIYAGRQVGTFRGNSDHGTEHASRAVGHVKKIAEYINQHYDWFGFKVSKDDVALAEYAALYHDSGRKNHIVDVFDETSAHRAEKQLGGRLKPAHLTKVTNAIKNKDASVNGKDHVAILLHEADCIEIQRVKPNFAVQYMDLFGLFCKNKGLSQEEALMTEEMSNLRNFAIGIYKKATEKAVVEKIKSDRFFLLGTFYNNDIYQFNCVVNMGSDDAVTNYLILPNMVTLSQWCAHYKWNSVEDGATKLINEFMSHNQYVPVDDIKKFKLNTAWNNGKSLSYNSYVNYISSTFNQYFTINSFSDKSILTFNYIVWMYNDQNCVSYYLLLPTVTWIQNYIRSHPELGWNKYNLDAELRTLIDTSWQNVSSITQIDPQSIQKFGDKCNKDNYIRYICDRINNNHA